MDEWVEAVVTEIRLHAEAAVLRRLDVGGGDPRSPSQIYLRDPAAQARIAGGTLRPHGSHRQANADVVAAISEASERSAKLVAPADSRFAIMTRRLAIDATATGLVAATLA